MVRFDTPGGVYADALPNGAWACVRPQDHALATHVGRIPLPPELPHDDGPRALFTRIASLPFRIAIKAHDTGAVWIWTWGIGWQPDVRISPGTQGHAWTPGGLLCVLAGVPHQDSQGLRYYDPAAGPDANQDVTGQTPGWVTGSPTYGPASALARRLGVVGLWEWTALGDGLFVGQGEHGGCVVQHPTLGHRLLAPEAARFIQAHREGDSLAIAFSVLDRDPTRQAATCCWLTVAEIADLPVYAGLPPDVPPDTPPEEPPHEEPPPMRRLTTHERAVTAAFVARFGLPAYGDDGADARRWTRQVAEQLAFSVSPAWGTKRADPTRPPSTDVVAIMDAGRLIGFDLILAQGGPEQRFVEDPEPLDLAGQTFIPVTPTNHLGPVPPPTDPPDVPPPSVDLAPVLARLDRIEAKLDALLARPAGEWAPAVEELKRFHQLEEREALRAVFREEASKIRPKLW